MFKSKLLLTAFLSVSLFINAQYNPKDKGLLWEITGKGLKKPSYVYGTMHISQKLAFHLGDSFYLTLKNCDVVALEQNLDSVIHKWITNEDDDPENIGKVYPRNTSRTLQPMDFTLSLFDKEMVQYKLSAEIREVNYLLKRGQDDNFEESAWLDLYIYQLGKKLKKYVGGVEGYEESRKLVEKAYKEPKENEDKNKKLKYFNRKFRDMLTEAYRKGDIAMIDSIDRMTESEHFREYMLYKRNANMVRRMDSIMKTGQNIFMAVGCAHLPNQKGVLQMLADLGYKVRPVQSIAKEKSKLAKKYEDIKFKHIYTLQTSPDKAIEAYLPMKLMQVREYGSFSSYLSTDLVHGHFYQIDRIACLPYFTGKTVDDIMNQVDSMTYEYIPGEQMSKKTITSNGFKGYDIVTKLNTGDLNRFQILFTPFNIYIIRLAGKEKFIDTKEGKMFFDKLNINENASSEWNVINSSDSTFSVSMPLPKNTIIEPYSPVNAGFETVSHDSKTEDIYVVKQEDILNNYYMEEDTFELTVLAYGFSKTDKYKIISQRDFKINGFYARDVVYKNKVDEDIYARFVLTNTRYTMFLFKPTKGKKGFDNQFFNSIKFFSKPKYNFFEYQDTATLYKVQTPVNPLLLRKEKDSYRYYYDEDESDDNDDEKSKSIKKKFDNYNNTVYFNFPKSSDFIEVTTYQPGFFQNYTPKKERDYNIDSMLGLKTIYKKKYLKDNVKYERILLTDTNTNKFIQRLYIQKGINYFYLTGFVDSVSGNLNSVNRFFSSFDVSDVKFIEKDKITRSQKLIKSLTGTDSVEKAKAAKLISSELFNKEDINDLKNLIDTISVSSKNYNLKSVFINKLGLIDSSQNLIVPYLTKKYSQYEDTSFLQFAVLNALLLQKSESSYNAVKNILKKEMPISSNSYTISNLFYSFDSLKLVKNLLPEFFELSAHQDYKFGVYRLLSKMRDSGMISAKDYQPIHTRLINELRIEFYKKLDKVTSEMNNSNDENSYRYNRYSSYDYDYITIYDYLLKLNEPLLPNSPELKNIASKMLKQNDNNFRMSVMNFLHNNKYYFHDSVYFSLAKNDKFRKKLYINLIESNNIKLFPDTFKNQYFFAVSELKNRSSYTKVDTFVFIERKQVSLKNNSVIVYIFKYKTERDNDWKYYFSSSYNADTNVIYKPKSKSLINSKSTELDENQTEAELISDYLFMIVYKSKRNYMGYFENQYSSSYEDIFESLEF